METLVGIAWLALLAFGAWGVFLRLVNGHADANYGSYVVWGLWVAAYIYFIGLSAGAFLMSSLVFVFRVKQLEHIGKLSLFVALITLFMALLAIWFDLGHMERFFYVFTRPNFSSMMTWMVWLYTGYFLLLLAELYVAIHRDLAAWAERPGVQGVVGRLLLLGRPAPSAEGRAVDARILRVLGAIGIPLAIAFHGGVGALFGTVAARPYWHTPLYPILFLTGALVSGGALITAAVAYFWPPAGGERRRMVMLLGKLVLGLLLFDLLLEFAEFSIPMWYAQGPENELLRKVLFGPFWWVFWVVHLLLGSLVPAVILVLRGDRSRWVGAACGLIAVSFMAVRLNIVVPGLIEPQLQGIEEAFANSRLTFQYVPSAAEWGVVGFLIAVGFGLLYAGARLLPLFEPNDASIGPRASAVHTS
jgi:molybdopterin-containing oxidoreductase family membrane subunit